MTTSNRIRWGVSLLLVLLAGGASAGYGYHRHVQESSRAKAANCLRQIASGYLAYANAAATQPAVSAEEQERVWALLATGGQVVVLRHATTTPGHGDPPGFKLGDCSTQRNLSDDGRAEARRLGAAFREHKIPVGRVLSSQYCRCLDTAKLAFEKSEAEPALNSAFEDREKRAAQTQAAKKLIASAAGGKDNLVLVTHSTNINALTELVPDMGEMIVLTPTEVGFRFAGRMKVGQ